MNHKIKLTDKVLFIVHLAIGDFTYMQNCFKKLKDRYPQLKIDLFIQDIRITNDSQKIEQLKNYILYEWLEETGLFNKVYYAYSYELFNRSVEECKKENYPYVISLGDLRSQNYSKLAREIAQNKIAAGIDIPTNFFSFETKKELKMLDIRIKDLKDKTAHISEKFAYWFEQIADLHFSTEDRYPFINIPQKWDIESHHYLKRNNWSDGEPVVFINIFAKGEERCWTLDEASDLIKALQKQPSYHNALFILNALPEDRKSITDFIHKHQLLSTVVFSAQKSFFELPALLKKCTLIITVDTSIMHLATFSEAQLVSLLRKNRRKPSPRWLPLKKDKNTIIYTNQLGAPIKSISAQQVLNELLQAN